MWKPVAMAATVVAVCATTASAQATQQPPPATATVAPTEETRPARTTPMGDTGLWFVPTGEVLPARRWSFSVNLTNFDFNQGFSDVSDRPVTFGVGLGDRAEIFGAWS